MTALGRLGAAFVSVPAIRATADSKLPPRVEESADSDAERRNRGASTASTSGSEERRRRRRRDLLLLASSSALSLSFPAVAPAYIQSTKAVKRLPPGTKLRPPPPRGKEDSVSVAADAATVRRLIDEAREASSRGGGDWGAARSLYLEAFAFFDPERKERRIASAEAARIPAALALAELGEPEGALLELEDALAEGTPALRGSGEVHAALAALRYSLRRKGAERELGEATALEPRWGDETWVRDKARDEKFWPPSMVSRLVKFLELD